MSGLLIDDTGAVVRLTINRPDAASTVDLGLATALRDTVRALSPEVRVVVLASSGTAFCGGGDVRETVATDDPAEHLRRLALTFHEALLALDESNAVTIAEIGGPTAGGGLGLALHADVVIASERARFLTAYDRIAVTPDSGVTDLLPRTIGLHRALQLTVLGRELDAATALAWGLVSEVVPHGELADRVVAIADRLASASTEHLAATARQYRAVDVDHATRLDEEAASIARFSATPTAAGRMARFAGRTGGIDV